MTSALDNAIATATFTVEMLEAGAKQTATVKPAMTNLINHLRTLDPTGERTADLIKRLEVFA